MKAALVCMNTVVDLQDQLVVCAALIAELVRALDAYDRWFLQVSYDLSESFAFNKLQRTDRREVQVQDGSAHCTAYLSPRRPHPAIWVMPTPDVLRIARPAELVAALGTCKTKSEKL